MTSSFRTLVIGATTNPTRYAYSCIKRLVENELPVVAFGIKEGEVFGVPIQTQWQTFKDIHTVTLYVGPARQATYIDKIIALKPARVIFNPGTEHPAFEAQLEAHGIQTLKACTLVLLATNQYQT